MTKTWIERSRETGWSNPNLPENEYIGDEKMQLGAILRIANSLEKIEEYLNALSIEKQELLKNIKRNEERASSYWNYYNDERQKTYKLRKTLRNRKKKNKV